MDGWMVCVCVRARARARARARERERATEPSREGPTRARHDGEADIHGVCGVRPVPYHGNGSSLTAGGLAGVLRNAGCGYHNS
eukprot:2154386-Prymnesium_polylepis.2